MTNSGFASPIPVTLNFSGGISLGAYMAGIFYELTKAAMQPDAPILIDIITGGSAGAITGTLATYYLLGAEPLPADATQSLFYKAWIEKVDITEISGVGRNAEIDQQTQQRNWSLLSGEAIANIADNLVKDLAQKLEAQPTRSNTKPLALVMTLTNLQGLLKKTIFSQEPCEDSAAPDSIETISSAETRRFLFHSKLPIAELDAMWQKVILSARGSGAFPVAFPPVGDISNINSPNLKLLSNDYFKPDTEPRQLDQQNLEEIYVDPVQLKFQYTDGGVLDGLPIVKGIILKRELLDQQINTLETPEEIRFKDFQAEWNQQWQQLNCKPEDRLYLFIQPTPANDLKSERRLTKGMFSMLEVAMSGLTLPKAEHDAIRLEEIRLRNEDAERREQLLETTHIKLDQLMSAIDQVEGDAKQQLLGVYESLQQELPQAIQTAIPYWKVKLCRIDPSLIANGFNGAYGAEFAEVQRALRQYLPEYMKAAIDKSQPDIKKSGDVKQLLACDFLGAFGGFFNRKYREHDFLLGRICGQIWLLQTCEVPPTEKQAKIQALVNLIATESHKFCPTDPSPKDLVPPNTTAPRSSSLSVAFNRYIRFLFKDVLEPQRAARLQQYRTHRNGNLLIIEDLVWRLLKILLESSPKSDAAPNPDNVLVQSIQSRILGKIIGKLALGVILPIVILAVLVGVLVGVLVALLLG